MFVNRLSLLVKRFKTAVPKQFRKFSGGSEQSDSYSTGVQIMHWGMGICLGGAVSTVLLAQNTKDKEEKGKYMWIHKSFGTAAAMLIVPRLVFRLTSSAPGPIPGTQAIERILANIGHLVMYGFAIFLPVSGVVMVSLFDQEVFYSSLFISILLTRATMEVMDFRFSLPHLKVPLARTRILPWPSKATTSTS